MVKYKVFTVARTKEVGKGGDQRREQECIRHPDTTISFIMCL